LSNRVIVITGGTSGIGKDTAILFARDKEHVVIMSRSEKAGAETVAQIQAEGGSVLYLKTDIGNEEQVEASFAKVIEKFGRIDVLYANAAIQICKPVLELSKQEWDTMISANLTGTYLATKTAAKYMKEKKSGCIIIASSGHAFLSYPGYTGYAATKGGQVAFMHAAAIDLAPYGIRVNCIIPGATETPLMTYHLSIHPEDEQKIKSKIPLGRFATGEDIARGVRILASEDAGYITGSCLMVEGGLLAQG
jgi:NAD(P)-dependent dehydrogenase (short-subunit alcohol dehydrogenase family)